MSTIEDASYSQNKKSAKSDFDSAKYANINMIMEYFRGD